MLHQHLRPTGGASPAAATAGICHRRTPRRVSESKVEAGFDLDGADVAFTAGHVQCCLPVLRTNACVIRRLAAGMKWVGLHRDRRQISAVVFRYVGVIPGP